MFPNLNAEMARANMTALDLAKATHKTIRSVRDKMTGRSEFTLNEIFVIRNELFPGMSIEYLFSKERQPS